MAHFLEKVILPIDFLVVARAYKAALKPGFPAFGSFLCTLLLVWLFIAWLFVAHTCSFSSFVALDVNHYPGTQGSQSATCEWPRIGANE